MGQQLAVILILKNYRSWKKLSKYIKSELDASEFKNGVTSSPFNL